MQDSTTELHLCSYPLPGFGTVLIAFAAFTFLTGCSAEQSSDPPQVLISNAPDIGALASLPDGGLLYGLRATGDIYRSDSAGQVDPRPVVHVDVSNDAQSGLIGLAVDRKGTVFVARTSATDERQLQIAAVENGTVRVVWNGPASADFANGGRLAFTEDDQLIIGIGDLTDSGKAADPTTVNGKMLSLDPDGAPTQQPRIVSGGWHNPFAFTIRADGSIWVADDSPAADERLARADVGGAPTSVTIIGSHSAPSGLTESTSGKLFVCAFTSGTLQAYQVDGRNQSKIFGKPVANDCSTAVVTLSDGRLAYASATGINTVTLR